MIQTVLHIVEKERSETDAVTFEEAMKRIKFGKFQSFIILISGLFMGSAFYETMGINYVLPVAECDLNITSKSQYGLISGVWFLGIILTSHSWGFLSDAYGRRKMLIVASLSAFFASVLSSVAVNLWQMILFRLLNGLCISGSTSIVFAYLGEFLGDKNRSRSMMVSSVMFGACCLSLPVLAWLVINQKWSFVIPLIDVTYKPWRFFLLACGFPSLICGVALFFFPESPKFTFAQGKEEKTLGILNRIYTINTGYPDLNIYKLKPSEETKDSFQSKNIFKMMFKQIVTLCQSHPRSIGILSLLQFCVLFVSNGMLLFFPDILNQTAKFMQESGNVTDTRLCVIVESAIREQHAELRSIEIASECTNKLEISSFYYGMLLEVCYIIGFMIVSWLVNYTGRLAIFTFIFVTTGVCGFAVNFAGTAAGTYLYVWLLVCGMNSTLLNTVTYDLFPTNLRSLAMSISLMFGRLGALAGGNIAGVLLESHCEATFTLSGVVMIFSGVMTFLIPNILKKK